MRERSGELRLWFLPTLVLLITALLVIIIFALDLFDGPEFIEGIRWRSIGGPYEYETPGVYEDFTWAFEPAKWTAIIGATLATYLGGTQLIVRLSKRHDRNLVAWTTAAIVFTPVIAGIAYLLTWPKGKSLKD